MRPTAARILILKFWIVLIFEHFRVMLIIKSMLIFASLQYLTYLMLKVAYHATFHIYPVTLKSYIVFALVAFSIMFRYFFIFCVEMIYICLSQTNDSFFLRWNNLKIKERLLFIWFEYARHFRRSALKLSTKSFQILT